MSRLTLKSIKRENARKVLEAIARKKHITKLEISEETELSLMTVGKIVSMLGAGGIITHSKPVSQKAGRRAEVFRIRHDWLIPVFEISSRIFRFYITDLEGNITDKVEYFCCDEQHYVANELLSFLHNAAVLLKARYKNKKALGVGVSITGVYDSENDKIIASMMPELSSIKLMYNISKIFKNKNIVIDNANRLCAAGLVENIAGYEDKTISCITVSDSIEVTTCDKGVYLSGRHDLAGRLGDIPFAGEDTYANFMRDAKNTVDIFNPMLDLLKIISVAYDPDIIYLCSDKFIFTPEITSRLHSSLQCGMTWRDRAPELHAVNSSTIESMSGVISRVIGNWLDDLLSDE